VRKHPILGPVFRYADTYFGFRQPADRFPLAAQGITREAPSGFGLIGPARQIPFDNQQGGITVQLFLRQEQASRNKARQAARRMIFIIAAPSFQARIALVHESDGQRWPGPAEHFDDRSGSSRVADAYHRDAGRYVRFEPLNKFVGRHNLDRNTFSVR